MFLYLCYKKALVELVFHIFIKSNVIGEKALTENAWAKNVPNGALSVSGGSRNFERGGEFANKLIFFLKIYQYIKIKYEQLY